MAAWAGATWQRCGQTAGTRTIRHAATMERYTLTVHLASMRVEIAFARAARHGTGNLCCWLQVTEESPESVCR